jgi:hypothetical protein
MEQWALILGDTLLILVTLAGGVATTVRMRRLGGAASALAGSGCLVALLAMVFDLIWWLVVYRNLADGGSYETYSNIGVLVTMLLITVAVGLLIAAANAGRPAAGTQPNAARPHAGQPHTGQPHVGQFATAPGQPGQAVPAGGWSPPATGPGGGAAQPNDWNVMSGVWSIPRGTFDGPPPSPSPNGDLGNPGPYSRP